GRRSRIVRLNAHRRRRDLRIPRHRQQVDREQSEQRDDDRDHGAEDRAPDEEVARLAHFAAAADFVLSTSATGFTTRPGPTFCVPSTITRSPGDRPESMIHTEPLHGPGFTSRAATVSPAPTT